MHADVLLGLVGEDVRDLERRYSAGRVREDAVDLDPHLRARRVPVQAQHAAGLAARRARRRRAAREPHLGPRRMYTLTWLRHPVEMYLSGHFYFRYKWEWSRWWWNTSLDQHVRRAAREAHVAARADEREARREESPELAVEGEELRADGAAKGAGVR